MDAGKRRSIALSHPHKRNDSGQVRLQLENKKPTMQGAPQNKQSSVAMRSISKFNGGRPASATTLTCGVAIRAGLTCPSAVAKG